MHAIPFIPNHQKFHIRSTQKSESDRYCMCQSICLHDIIQNQSRSCMRGNGIYVARFGPKLAFNLIS